MKNFCFRQNACNLNFPVFLKRERFLKEATTEKKQEKKQQIFKKKK